MRIPHPTVDWRHPHWNKFGVALLLIWLVALALRLPGLNERPMHTDEAVQADKAVVLWTTGQYKYDPEEYHGPSLYYMTIPLLWLTGKTTYADVEEANFRIVTVIFGAGLIFLLMLTIDGLGPWSSIWAACLLTISPMMVFYSRYYIQEMLLVFLSYLFMATVWRYTRGAPAIWALLAGATLGLMHATKETWVLSVGAMGVAALLTYLWSHWIDKRPIEWRAHWQPHLKLRGVLLGGALAIILFSSLGTNPRGPLDSIRAYSTYLNRGGGEGDGGSSGGSDSDHVHPAGFYSGRLMWTKYDYKRNEILFWDMVKQPALFKKPSAGPAWSEAFIIVLALCGLVAALARRGLGRAHLDFLRFLAFYTVMLALIYEIIPYKTPWCALGFWHTAILLAGFGAAALVRALTPMPLKIIAVVLLLFGTAQLARQSLAANSVPQQQKAGARSAKTSVQKWRDSVGYFGADERNPWIYAHTSMDIFNLTERMDGLAQATPDGYDILVKVVATDPWPLPWYLRRFKSVGFYSAVPDDLAAGNPQVIIAAQDDQDAVAGKFANYQQEIFGHRPRAFLVANIQPRLWEKFLKTRQ